MMYKNAISGRLIPPDQYNILTAHEQRSFIPVDDNGNPPQIDDLPDENQDDQDDQDDQDESGDLGADLVAGALGVIGSEIAGALETGGDTNAETPAPESFGGFGGGDGGGGGAEGSF
jgi:hypothetical protein